MHHIEPHYAWRDYYVAEEDEHSPFHGREYSEIYYTHAIYNHLIHPQWDEIGSPTLFIKVLFADYEGGYCIIEMIGEWNDCLHNDVMYLKRNIIEPMVEAGLNKFVLIGENVLNFHSSDDCYYEEWFDELGDGWIAAINFRDFVIKEFEQSDIDRYIAFGKDFSDVNWRKFTPAQLCEVVDRRMMKRLNP